MIMALTQVAPAACSWDQTWIRLPAAISATRSRRLIGCLFPGRLPHPGPLDIMSMLRGDGCHPSSVEGINFARLDPGAIVWAAPCRHSQGAGRSPPLCQLGYDGRPAPSPYPDFEPAWFANYPGRCLAPDPCAFSGYMSEAFSEHDTDGSRSPAILSSHSCKPRGFHHFQRPVQQRPYLHHAHPLE